MIPELAIQIERQLQRLEGADDADRPRVREEVTAELVRLCEMAKESNEETATNNGP